MDCAGGDHRPCRTKSTAAIEILITGETVERLRESNAGLTAPDHRQKVTLGAAKASMDSSAMTTTLRCNKLCGNVALRFVADSLYSLILFVALACDADRHDGRSIFQTYRRLNPSPAIVLG